MNRNPSERRSTTKTARFRFRLLGRFAAWRNDVPLSDIEIGSRKGRTLLKLLLVDRGHVVGIDRIAEVLWGEPAENADRLIASLISRLRGVVGADALEIMAYEKIGRFGDLVVPAIGTGLLLLAGVVFIHPAWLPQVFGA